MTTLHEELKEQREAAFGGTGDVDPYAAYRKAGEKTLATLVFFEGCSYDAYKDYVKVDTIGIGNTRRPDGSKVEKNDRIKDNQELLEYVGTHLEKETYPIMKKYITRDLSENETAALVSLIYNYGPRVLCDSKTGKPTALAKAINANDKAAIEREWLKYNRTKNGVDRTLTIRRAMECAIFADKLDVEKLRVCTYGKVNLARIYRGGKLDKSEAAYRYMAETCQKEPSAVMMKKFAYFNYGKPVGTFVKGLTADKTHEAAAARVAVLERGNGR